MNMSLWLGFCCGVMFTSVFFRVSVWYYRRRKTSTLLSGFRPSADGPHAYMSVSFDSKNIYVHGWGERWSDVYTSEVYTGAVAGVLHEAFLVCCVKAQIDPATGRSITS